MTRRHWLASTAGAMAAAQDVRRGSFPGLCLNQDATQFYMGRADHAADVEHVASWVDQYANTQVRELILNVNAMRAAYASKVRDSFWTGYDPAGPDDQPLFRSQAPEARKSVRKWVDYAYRLNAAGIDPYSVWIARARKKGLTPWISVRMNDVHNTEDEQHYLHSSFWKQHPQFRRVSYRFQGTTERALDYEHPEVREYTMAFVREVCERYDFDGLELDWMRFPYHFRPGREQAGLAVLSGFMREARAVVNAAERRRGHKIRIAVRVPAHPESAMKFGYDVAEWCRSGACDYVTITPFWGSTDTDMPVELWRQLLGDNVTIAAGLEILIRPYPAYRPLQSNSLETTRGVAAAHLQRGADRVYLFNYFDDDPGIADCYAQLLKESGSLATLAGKPRRHVLTYPLPPAVGEAVGIALPAEMAADSWRDFRIATGPREAQARVRMGVEGGDPSGWEVRVNGELCRAAGADDGLKPGVNTVMHGYAVPATAMQNGSQVISVHAKSAGRIVWVEMAIA